MISLVLATPWSKISYRRPPSTFRLIWGQRMWKLSTLLCCWRLKKKVDEIQRNLDLALGASGEDYHARLWFTAARSLSERKHWKKIKEAFVNVTDRDSTRADAWLGQSTCGYGPTGRSARRGSTRTH